MAYKPRSLVSGSLVAVAIGIVALIGFWLWNSLGSAYPAVVRQRYLDGEITLEEARQEVGHLLDVDEWPKVKARIDAWKESADPAP